jgi:hypothetical protein
MSTPEARSTQGGIIPAIFAQTAITGAMAVCLAIALTQFEHALMPAWRIDYIPVLSFAVALIATLTTRLMQRPSLPLPRYVLRSIELGVLFVAARSVLGLLRGPDFSTPFDPMYGKDERELIMLAAILGAVWMHSSQLTHCLLEMSDVVPLNDRAWMQDLDGVRQLARKALTALLYLSCGGMVLLVVILHAALRNSGADANLSILHLLIYLGLGLILLSQTRLTGLRSGWIWERVAITPHLSARWNAATLLILIGMAVIALALPAQYPLGLFATLSYLVMLVIALVQLIYFAVAYLFALLVSLLLPNAAGAIQPPPPPIDLFATTDAGPSLISEFIQSLAFWLLFLAVIGYLIYQYVQRNPVLKAALQQLPVWQRLARWWRRVRRLLGVWGKRMTTALQVRRAARSTPTARSSASARRWINPRRLSPREQIQFYYRALLRRGSERGLPRQPAQTPLEYAHDLQQRVPEVDEDVSALTDEFVEARYSQHAIEPERVNAVRRYWARIKAALKRR